MERSPSLITWETIVAHVRAPSVVEPLLRQKHVLCQDIQWALTTATAGSAPRPILTSAQLRELWRAIVILDVCSLYDVADHLGIDRSTFMALHTKLQAGDLTEPELQQVGHSNWSFISRTLDLCRERISEAAARGLERSLV